MKSRFPNSKLVKLKLSSLDMSFNWYNIPIDTLPFLAIDTATHYS